MTYPLNPTYLRQPTEWNRLAHEEDVPLLRNDVIFRELAQRGTLDQYLLHDHWHPNGRGYQLVTGNVLDFITAMTRAHVFCVNVSHGSGPPTSGVEMGSSGR